jgi:hypothetical protein
MVIPRNWGPVELQRSPEQTVRKAIPAATDARFKVAPFFLLISWLTIVVSLWHSVRHYEPRNRGLLNRIVGFLRYVPFRFILMIPLALVVVAYQALAAWDFDVSPLKKNTNLLAMYLGGYAPALLIVWILCISGFMRPNEDKELIRQRRERGSQLDQELGISKKPAWWRRVRGEVGTGDVVRDQLFRNVREVGGHREVRQPAERRAADIEANAPANNTFEMSSIRRAPSNASSTRPPSYSSHLYNSRPEQRQAERAIQVAASLLFPNANNPPPAENTPIDNRGRDSEPRTQQSSRAGGYGRSSSTGSDLSITAPPQQIRSMLDV